MLIEKWSDGTCHITLSKRDPEWKKYPFGETVVQHDGRMP
jgi:hypothetical protein